VSIDFRVVDSPTTPTLASTCKYALTLLSEEISATALADATSILAKYGANIDNITRLSQSALSCLEIEVSISSDTNIADVRADILSACKKHGVDTSLQVENVFRYNKRLVVMDMDGIILAHDVFADLFADLGLTERAVAIDNESLDNKTALLKKVELFRGFPVVGFIWLLTAVGRFC
jgi:phosphoserine phosphatase